MILMEYSEMLLCYPDFDDVGLRITLYYLDFMNKGRVCYCYADLDEVVGDNYFH